MAALQIQTRIFGGDSVETLKTGVLLAALWAGAKGEYAKANKFYLANLSRLRAEQKKGTINADYLGSALNGFALLRRAQGDSKEAENLLQEALALRPYVSPEQENGVGLVQAILALTQADQGKFDEAIKTVRERIEAIRRQKGNETPRHMRKPDRARQFPDRKGRVCGSRRELARRRNNLSETLQCCQYAARRQSPFAGAGFSGSSGNTRRPKPRSTRHWRSIEQPAAPNMSIMQRP